MRTPPRNPNVVGSAYTNSFAGATATTLYGLDTNLDILVTQNPPNDGTLNTVGQLGANFSGRSSFDISAATTTASATTVTGIATPLAPNGEVLQATQLYRINLGNGAATLIGSFPPGIVVNAISAPTPEAPGTKFGNISTRVGVGTADNVSIAGFIITGNEPKRVLVRGIGPSLATLGISSPVADPLLQLYNSDNVVIATNDNWKETQEGEIRATNIPPQNDLESAIIRTLEPGRYTAVERSKDGTDNIGLVEVFDVNPASDSQLSNLSTRGFVGTQERVMIGGLIIAGTDPVRVVVRAIGPSMTTVTGTLADPTLELFDANGVSLAFNDDWRETQESELMQTELAPTNNKESAIVRNLAPSRYTAIVRGKNGTTGVALVEFYRAAEQPN